MEKTNGIVRSEIWKKIYDIVKTIPREKLTCDAPEASSVAVSIEELFLKLLPIHGVMPSAYLMNIDNEATIVEAQNISDAMDKAEATGSKDYEMVYSKSLPILH